MDTVLGVSMAPKTVRMVLVEGGNADGVTVDEEKFDLSDGDNSANTSGPDQVISAILGTQEGAAASGYQLMSTGVVWTDPVEAAALRDALAQHKMENVMLVSAFLAAAALAQEVGSATGHDQTALLLVEPDAATLAMVDSADGSISDVRRQPLQGTDPAAELAALVSATTQALPTRPGGLFVVGNGVDIAPIKPALEAATSLIVSVPEEPETALARGAALASANAPLFSSSTAAMAWAQDPGTGAFDAYGAAVRYADAPVDGRGEEGLAYSAVAGDDANANTAMAPQDDVEFGTAAYPDFADEEQKPQRRPLWMVASAVATLFVVGVVALVVALAVGIRPHVGTRPQPGSNIVAPTNPAPAPNAPPPGAPAPASAPAPAIQAPAPAPAAPAPEAPAPAPAAPAPAAPAP
ncbi:MAG: hypothetical protein WA317_21945, partial [Mycobacterium sp.]|uniref:DUF7159 family protein n=1 Tax=Mycobacterium sp. TaxID=1785 RepID=UPI003CC520B7